MARKSGHLWARVLQPTRYRIGGHEAEAGIEEGAQQLGVGQLYVGLALVYKMGTMHLHASLQ
jgi:hypothetical protein